MFLGGLGPLTPQNNGWCCDRDEGGVNRVRGSGWVYLTLPAFLKMKRPASIWGGIRKNNDLTMTLCCHG